MTMASDHESIKLNPSVETFVSLSRVSIMPAVLLPERFRADLRLRLST